MARATAPTASSWPTTRSCSALSSRSSRRPSSSVMAASGSPVQEETTSATSSRPTTRERPPSMRTREAASSSRSMALSGRKRSFIYRAESCTAAETASSEMPRPWWLSSPRLRAESIFSQSARPGSGTFTGWKRRSSAASFSMCRRYSSSVVAPITWISPRPRAGLMMLAASMAPSAEPAPTSVCSSSMNTITSPARRTSRSTALMRSSKSPRYLVPASMLGTSSVTMRIPRRLSGTSPRATRWASPSATAVLPTPGSPTSTGLFFVRRERIWMTRLISRSRQTTGSVPPPAASCVRSRPYWSSSRVCACRAG